MSMDRSVQAPNGLMLRDSLEAFWAVLSVGEARPPLVRVLLALWLVDAAFIFFHALIAVGIVDLDAFRLERDGGVPEFFQYAKWLGASSMLFAVFMRERNALLLMLSAICLFLLADDSLRLHERVGGELLADGLFGHLGTNAYHVGEGAYAVALMTATAMAFLLLWRSASITARVTATGVAAFLGVFVAGSVGIDQLHGVVASGGSLSGLFSGAEEVTEHLALSLLLWWCILRGARKA